MANINLNLALSLAGVLVLSACSSAGNDDRPESEPSQPVNPVTEIDEPNNGPPVTGAPDVCTTEGLNSWVDAQMRDYYIYADQVPVVNPAEYEDASALLDDLRVPPDIYSGIGSASTSMSELNDGERFGFGINWRVDAAGNLVFASMDLGSPLGMAGVRRGDSLLALNGVPREDFTLDIVLDILALDSETPTTVTFTIAPVDGQTRNLEVTSGVYVQNTVPNTFVYTNGNNKIGYIEFTRFLRPSEAALDNSLANLLNEQITDLVLDLRYNGGGFTYIARKLASQIAGPDFVGQTMYRNTFNEKYSSRNEIREFELQRLNLSLPRVIILTTGSTASSSEIVANSLKPYLDVVLIGSRTNGKPFTSSGRVNCGQVLNAMEITRTNSAGESVLGGLEPTCEVIDTYNHEQGSIDDSLIGGMLTYVIDGVCPTAIIADSSNEAEVRKARNQFSSLEFDEFNVRGGVLVETLAAPTDKEPID